MKPLMLPEGWISCLGRILMLGVDSLWRGSSEKPGQEILKTYTSKMRFTTEDGISPVCASASSPSLYVNCRSNATLCKDNVWWQPCTPSVPRFPAKTAFVPSHLLRPSSLSLPSLLFSVSAFGKTHLSCELLT